MVASDGLLNPDKFDSPYSLRSLRALLTSRCVKIASATGQQCQGEGNHARS